MTPEQFKDYFANLKQEITHYIDSDAPLIVGKMATDFFTENFQKEGFTDNGVQRWKEVKRRLNPKNADFAAASRPILTGNTGNLGMSINYKDAGNGSVTIYSDMPHSSAHNEGTANAGKSHNVVIPKRQFIGESNELNKKIAAELKRKIDDVLKK